MEQEEPSLPLIAKITQYIDRMKREAGFDPSSPQFLKLQQMLQFLKNSSTGAVRGSIEAGREMGKTALQSNLPMVPRELLEKLLPEVPPPPKDVDPDSAAHGTFRVTGAPGGGSLAKGTAIGAEKLAALAASKGGGMTLAAAAAAPAIEKETLKRILGMINKDFVGPAERAAPFSSTRPNVTVKGGKVTRPEIYENPQKIVNDSEKMVADENPLLKELFGVDRHDLDQLQLERMNPSLASEHVYQPRGVPEHVKKVTTPANTQRMQDIVGLTAENPRFAGMTGWYNTDAMLKRPIELLGEEEGAKFVRDHHLFASPMSAMSEVEKEIGKGTYAHLLARQGRLGEFYDPDLLPPGLNSPAHTTAHSAGARNMERTGGKQFWKDSDPSQKTPIYFDTKTGDNFYYPTGDAHFVRGVGLPDARPLVPDPKNRGGGADRKLVPNDGSIKKTEMMPIGQWYNDKVAMPLGLSGGVAQPLQWGGMASATGVESKIGAPYLELLANNIEKSAKRQGITPAQAWDQYILGKVDPRKGYLGFADPELLAALGIGSGGLAAFLANEGKDEVRR